MELAAYQRAASLDPLWFRTTGAQGIALAERGERARAEAVARHGFANDIPNQHILLGRIAWIVGDYSEAVRNWTMVARANSPRWSFRAQEDLSTTMAALGLAKLSEIRTGMRRASRVSIDPLPTPDTWRQHNRNTIAADVYSDENETAAKLMLRGGHSGELMSTYTGSAGLLGLQPGKALQVDQLGKAPVVVLALRQAGRFSEAARLLRDADIAVQRVYLQKEVPFWFDAEAAGIWATEGRKDAALSALETAVRRGWTYTGNADLPDMADEPAFAALRGEPRFERLRLTLSQHFARERVETDAIARLMA